jgi:hypothetical protein
MMSGSVEMEPSRRRRKNIIFLSVDDACVEMEPSRRGKKKE